MTKEEAEKDVKVAAIARIRKLTIAYRSKPRTDSLRRFIRRIVKPKSYRYQSLLRGAMRAKMQRVIVDDITIRDTADEAMRDMIETGSGFHKLTTVVQP